MPQSSAPYIHSGDPAYAPPLLRAPSPSSSIGTDYGPDETPLEEKQKSQSEFLKGIQDRLRLNDARPEEAAANKDPLLPKPKDLQDEALIFANVMNNLRRHVQLLDENHLFEQAILRGSLVTEQRESSSGDIDSIMQSMMTLSSNPTTISNNRHPAADTTFDGPSTMQPSTPLFNMATMTETGVVASPPGRRSTRLKVKSRRP